MSDHWFKEYIESRNEARAMWKTLPPHRKAHIDQLYRSAMLEYGRACLIDSIRE